MRVTQETMERMLALWETAGLSERERQAMELHLRGCTQRVLADVLDISPGMVYRYLARARAKLLVHCKAAGRDTDRGWPTWLLHAIEGDIEEVVVRLGQRGEDEEYMVDSYWRRPTLLKHPGA